MDHQQALGNFGAKYTLEWNGVVYSFSFIGDAQKAWYEKAVKQAVYHAIESNEFSSDKTNEKLRFYDAVAADEYKWGDTRFDSFRRTREGSFLFFWMLLALDYPQLKRAEIEKMLEDKPIECAGIMALIFADSSIKSVNATEPQRQVALQKVYTQLMKPPEAGGIGLDIETLAKLTDRQKDEILREIVAKEEKPMAKPTTPETKKVMADVVTKFMTDQAA